MRALNWRRAVFITLAVACGLTVPFGEAGAGGAGGASTDGEGIDYGVISGGGSPGSGSGGGTPSGGGSSSPSNCTYNFVAVEAGTPIFDVDGTPINTDRSGKWYEKQCGSVYYGLIFVPAGTAGPVVSPRDVADGVLDRMNLPLPQPRISPAGDQLVNLPMWVWLEGWTTRQESASVPGVSVTVTAKPTKAVWTFGDGTTLTCQGPGVAWTPTSPPNPPCGHTFKRSSATTRDRTYSVKVAITWNASYTVAGGAGGGPLPAVVRTTEFAVRVAEVQAVNTQNGGRN